MGGGVFVGEGRGVRADLVREAVVDWECFVVLLGGRGAVHRCRKRWVESGRG